MSVAIRSVSTPSVDVPRRRQRRPTRRATPQRSGLQVAIPRKMRAASITSRAPVVLAIIPDRSKSKALRNDLDRRFGADYRVLVTISTQLAAAMLDRFRYEGIDVALVLADFQLPEGNGIEFLGQAHARHPAAKRALLTTFGDHSAAAPVHQAMALGEIDLTVNWPWKSPEEALYPQASEALAAWWRVHRPRFERVRIVGHQWDARSHELRDPVPEMVFLSGSTRRTRLPAAGC